ncbi:MAG TPA: prolyl oligopeptidase family serine peptidase [Vicinamibacterales bacterium]|nr:prolyl oligopeptidase family serine peptidase [Vicinamibacterales bacterium]
MSIRRSGALAFMALLIQAPPQWNYPPTKTVDAADTYFGQRYPDPYRWLEDRKDPDVQAWFKAQADLTDRLLARIPARGALADEWMALDRLRPASYSQITTEHGRVFYKKTLGGENVGKLYYRDGWTGRERLLFDPAAVTPTGSKPGDVATIQAYSASPDGQHVVLALTAGGAEYSELRVLEVDTRALRRESIYPSYGPLGWTMDSRSFFYDAGKVTDVKSPETELNRKTRLHRLGTAVDSDLDFLSNESYPELGITPKELPYAAIDESYPSYVVANIMTVENELRLLYAPAAGMAAKGKLKWSVLASPSDSLVRGIVMHDGHVYGVTHSGAPQYKIVRTSLDHPDWKTAETVIPEAKDSVQAIAHSRSFLFITYSNGITSRLVKHAFGTGRTSDVPLPASGTAQISCADFKSDRCIVVTTSWVQPTTIYDFDATTDTFRKSVFDAAVSYPGFESLVTEEVEVPGHDGALIPVSIIHTKNLKRDGHASAILQGYGAYGISLTPNFDVRHSIALREVVVAYAHVRGGGEKGEAWYRAGFKSTKPNTWKDFISVAEYLIDKGYTSAGKLAATGSSAGGILISRSVTERPDLFAAAVCNVGVANALRLEFTPNGPINTPEFGTVRDEAEARALSEMDGVQHVRPGVKYPAVLGVAGWNDPRVVPWQPGKFVAAMQAASTSGRPALLKINYDNGHFTEEKRVTFRNFAGQYAFMLWQTGHPEFQPSRLNGR